MMLVYAARRKIGICGAGCRLLFCASPWRQIAVFQFGRDKSHALADGG